MIHHLANIGCTIVTMTVDDQVLTKSSENNEDIGNIFVDIRLAKIFGGDDSKISKIVFFILCVFLIVNNLFVYLN